MMKKIFLLTAILALCNCQTPYQKLTKWAYTGGYMDEKLSDNGFKIIFSGNGYTPLDKAKDYALLRSAEVTIENSFQYFKIENSDAKSISTQRSHYSCANGICTPFTTNTVTPFVVNTISCYVDEPKSKDIIYNAKIVSDEMKQKYKIINK